MTLDSVSKENPFLPVVLGDFSTKLSHWYKKDSSISDRISVESIMSQFGLYQIINEPTHILEKTSLCTDLIFTSQPNLSAELGTETSLHSNCHHEIIYAKFKRFGTIKIKMLILSDDPFITSLGESLWE